jgi:hypothetical protein
MASIRFYEYKYLGAKSKDKFKKKTGLAGKTTGGWYR